MSFKTITLRNLDSRENEPVVKILTAFMSRNDIKTGQAAIEEIIKDYGYMKSKCERLEKQITYMQESNRITFDAAMNENAKYKAVIKNYLLFTQSLEEL
jgi:hypothetical protein